MVPSGLWQLLLFLVLLTPGAAFVLVKERRGPRQSLTALREVLRIVCASILADALALALFGLLRVCAPGLTPDAGALVREPGRYARGHYLSLLWWGAALLALAVAVAAVASSRELAERATRLPLLRRLAPRRPHESGVSAWWLAFTEHPEAEVHVGCSLEDGSYLTGRLRSFSTKEEDDADRELILTGPISHRPPGSAVVHELPEVGSVVLSARRITFLTVSYVVPEPVPEPVAEPVPMHERPLPAPHAPPAPARPNTPSPGSSPPGTPTRSC